MIVDSWPKIQIEVVIPDSDVDNLITTLIDSARTERSGTGKIFVIPVERSIGSGPARLRVNFDLFQG